MSHTKERIKQTIGSMMLPFMPARTARLTQESFSLTVGKRDFVDACLRAGLATKLLKKNEDSTIAEYHRKFWEKNNSLQYHRGSRDIVMQVFEDDFQFLASEIATLLDENPNLKTMVEIGSGGGDLLNHLANQFTSFDKLIGLDLSPVIIEENKGEYDNPKIEWIAGNGKTWVEDNGQANTVYLTFRGVLEYFTTQDLREMFGRISADKKPAVFILVEPQGLDHDMAPDFTSRPYNHEYSFSHNYPHILKECGFDIRHCETKSYDDHKLISVIASVGL